MNNISYPVKVRDMTKSEKQNPKISTYLVTKKIKCTQFGLPSNATPHTISIFCFSQIKPPYTTYLSKISTNFFINKLPIVINGNIFVTFVFKGFINDRILSDHLELCKV